MADGIITISGDRQDGKTRACLSIAIAVALAGRRVLFTAASHVDANDAILRAARMMSPLDVTKTTLSAGNRRIETRTGGVIAFITRSPSAGRGMDVDTLILDEWDDNQRHWEDLIPATNGSSTNPCVVIARKSAMADCEHVTHPEAWPGDAGAVIEAHTPDIIARIVNEAARATLATIADAIGADIIEPPVITADDVRAWIKDGLP